MDYCARITNTNKRVAYEESMDKLLRLKKYTETRNLTWVEVEEVTHSSEPVAVYDANMPETSTTVANGVVSHNSDVRLKMTSVSIPHAKGYVEEEDDIYGEGDDKYRYLKCRVHKNKLGGPQNTELSLRIRIESANGDATGFCRAWDAFNYLKMTGQIGGNRKKIKFLAGPFEGKAVSWIEFKALIDGNPALIKEGCKVLGVKPTRLYEWCRKQVRSGKGYQLMIDTKKASSKKSKEVDISDEDDDE
jgi:hypothetical protein